MVKNKRRTEQRLSEEIAQGIYDGLDRLAWDVVKGIVIAIILVIAYAFIFGGLSVSW